MIYHFAIIFNIPANYAKSLLYNEKSLINFFAYTLSPDYILLTYYSTVYTAY